MTKKKVREVNIILDLYIDLSFLLLITKDRDRGWGGKHFSIFGVTERIFKRFLTCLLATSLIRRAIFSKRNNRSSRALTWIKGYSNGLDLPLAFTITLGLPDSIAATQELLVPRSIPTLLDQNKWLSNLLVELIAGLSHEAARA